MRKALKLRWAWLLVGLVVGYLLTAYVILPRIDRWQTQGHPALLDGVRLTQTANGIPGDPLNISLVGHEGDVISAMSAAGWVAADPLTFRSSLRIAVDSVLDKPDEHAPLSDLFLFGRKEDLAFEKPVGHSPRERHHVRFWRTPKSDQGRAVWLGAATHDVGVELSHRTKQITHRISPAVDAERDLLAADLVSANRLLDQPRWIIGFHKELQGRNGGGDPWRTDGRLAIVTLPISKP